LPSERVTELITESVLVVAVTFDLGVLVLEELFLVAQDCFVVVVAVVAVDQNVKIEPVDNRLSCIFAMVATGVFAPTRSKSNCVSGKMRSVS